MNELRLPPDTPIQYEEGLWELCTDRAYEMMSHKRKLLDTCLLYTSPSPRDS